MELTVVRKYKKDKYTIGKLYIDGEYFCDTLEDVDRGLTSNMSVEEIKSKKVYGLTAIPTGTYKIDLNTISPKFSKYPFYMETCDGKLPRLVDVKGYTGVLIHVGEGYRGPDLTLGCILVGFNKIKGGLLNSKECFTKLMSKFRQVKSDEKIRINIEYGC